MPSAFKTSATRDEHSIEIKEDVNHDSPNGRYLKRNEASFRITVKDTLFGVTVETSSPSLYLNK